MATLAQQKEFIAKIAPIIQAEARKRGYKVCSPAIAQACCESAYGTSSLGYKYHNYFGMKCGSAWKGKSVNLQTKEEYKVGTLTTIRDNFRVYDTMEAGVAGYYDFISSKRYANLKDSDATQYCHNLKADGYATSSTYVNTLLKFIGTHNLTQYDGASVVVPTPALDIVSVAHEVIAGKWGNGADRKARLTAAGYDYNTIQKIVNELLRG